MHEIDSQEWIVRRQNKTKRVLIPQIEIFVKELIVKKKTNVTIPITVKKICLYLILGESRPWYLL